MSSRPRKDRRRPAEIAQLLLAQLLGVLGFISIPVHAWGEDSQDSSEREVLSRVYEVDRVYRSMMGPSSDQSIKLEAGHGRELAWITGYQVTMVEENGETPVSDEFMCHANLDVVGAVHRKSFGEIIPGWRRNDRLFTLSQGQLEIDFPKGFGIPVMSDEILVLNTQVLNLNHEEGFRNVRHKVAVEYSLDRDLVERPKALFSMGAVAMVALGDHPAVYGELHPTPEQEVASCLPGHAASEDIRPDGDDRKFSGHFQVEPGRHIYRTLVTKQMHLPYDTALHYIAAHLHPFAESLELRDLTTGETIYKAHVENFTDAIGLKSVEYYSSEEGIPVFKDHEYEVIAIYNNTSDEIQDAMAVLRLYAHEKTFSGPIASRSIAPTP